ncbi:cupin domain-containing protein [Chloroflexus sp.]|uniref:cupin domain-containing protein n=1 Tax=Chloroflexus sp. TaxID=1904827 RepID=UPI002ACDE8D6|nr:cupin domain-containing protein [Chloroflexus sp.]
MSLAAVHHLIGQINIPEDGIISRTIYQDATIKAVLFGFAAGQELSEHTAATPAIMHILQGEARITLGEEVVEAVPNMWVHMPARLPHSLQARTPVVMLLLLLKGSRE